MIDWDIVNERIKLNPDLQVDVVVTKLEVMAHTCLVKRDDNHFVPVSPLELLVLLRGYPEFLKHRLTM